MAVHVANPLVKVVEHLLRPLISVVFSGMGDSLVASCSTLARNLTLDQRKISEGEQTRFYLKKAARNLHQPQHIFLNGFGIAYSLKKQRLFAWLWHEWVFPGATDLWLFSPALTRAGLFPF